MGGENIPEQFNLTSILADKQVSLGHGGRVAYHSDEGPVTYGALVARQNRLWALGRGRSLRRSGSQNGHR